MIRLCQCVDYVNVHPAIFLHLIYPEVNSTLSAWQAKTNTCTNSVHPDEMANY